jgi:ATP-binding cassette subfamily C protein LapB
MLSRWTEASDQSRSDDSRMRKLGEHNLYLIQAMQQLAYVTLVASGALMVTRGELSMGALIACSILSSRILAPVAQLPNQMSQWAQAKMALRSLDQLWQLQDDHAGLDQALVPETLRGHYRFQDVRFAHGQQNALSIERLDIAAGQKIGILGPVGSGKTTLLRLLSGMYQPQNGRITLDGIDLSHISKPLLSEHLGYLPQDGRLFAGSLRENLILGLPDPGDSAILLAAQDTGLLASVIQPHPQGLSQAIHEGGTGLSGGQRQLVNLTRVVLRRPRIWLLDEPTASMDSAHEHRVIQTLHQHIGPQDSACIVTHKTDLLQLTERIIVIANHQIVIDGPREQVLAQLGRLNASSPAAAKKGIA